MCAEQFQIIKSSGVATPNSKTHHHRPTLQTEAYELRLQKQLQQNKTKGLRAEHVIWSDCVKL